MTERAPYSFDEKCYLKEDSTWGDPWIMVVPLDENLSILKRGYLGLDPRPGTTHEQAKQLAEQLRELVAHFIYTELESRDG